MMPPLALGWQDVVVFALAAAAVAWLARRAWLRRARPGCEDCPRCASADDPAHASHAPAPRLVQLRDPRHKR